MSPKPLTYKDAGVDIDAGNALVERIRPLVAKTTRPEVLDAIGGFGGLFALDTKRYPEPVLVSGTDGVGTKLKLAQSAGRHDTIGVDLVAMCVNDVLVSGAEPLFFLDYFASGRLDVDVAADVVAGIAAGCEQAGAALIGGETAEMPDMYAEGEYDLAGFCVGVVERSRMIDTRTIAAGDRVIGLSSSGPHSNGYSLIRRVLERDPDAAIDGRAASDVLLEPTRIYVNSVRRLLERVAVKGLAHVTGGGITENLPRILPAPVSAEIDTARWRQAAVFDWLAAAGDIDEQEMRRTFNCGIGMIAVVAADDVDVAIDALVAAGEKAVEIGRIVEGSGTVVYL